MSIEFKDLPEGGCRKWDCQSCGRHLKHDPTLPVAEITGGMESSPFSRGLKFVMQHYDRLPVGTKLYATQPVQPSLKSAAQAVLGRWDSPQWEWTKHGPTADLMNDLRNALLEAK